jgi:hypothetical protein
MARRGFHSFPILPFWRVTCMMICGGELRGIPCSCTVDCEWPFLFATDIAANYGIGLDSFFTSRVIQCCAIPLCCAWQAYVDSPRLCQCGLSPALAWPLALWLFGLVIVAIRYRSLAGITLIVFRLLSPEDDVSQTSL